MKESRALRAARTELKRGKAGLSRAVAIIKRAAENGDASAAYALATWFLFGKHVRKDVAAAIVLLRQAAKENIPEALYDLAVCYERGQAFGKTARKHMNYICERRSGGTSRQ
jgi:TPR repeat protein